MIKADGVAGSLTISNKIMDWGISRGVIAEKQRKHENGKEDLTYLIHVWGEG